MRARALETGTHSLAITFEPHPITVLAPQAPPQRLLSPSAKIQMFAELGLDRAWPFAFDGQVAALEPEAFLDRVCAMVDLRELWVGYDFRFGKGRRGDLDLLRREGATRGFVVRSFDAVAEESGAIFSSTRVRDALRAGDLEQALHVLGHTFWLDGEVVPGRGDGRRLLVPTANVRLPRAQLLPANGVYAAWAEVADEPRGSLVPCAVNVGTRPTLTADRQPTVEAHLIDWSGDLYGRPLRLHLGARQRGEVRFEGLEALRAQIHADIAAVRLWCLDRAPLQGASAQLLGGPPEGRQTTH